MNKRNILGFGSLMVALILSIVALTITLAAYNKELKINGSATAKGAKWSIVFSDLQDAKIGNDNGMTSTAKEITSPEIIGTTSIETYIVQLQTPGDYISYNFKIKNSGDFPAKIDSAFVMPTPSCKKGTSGVSADETNVCNNLEYTLKYVNDGSNVKAGDTLDVGETKEVQLKIYYKKTITQNQLPKDDVSIGNLNIIIPFVQY